MTEQRDLPRFQRKTVDRTERPTQVSKKRKRKERSDRDLTRVSKKGYRRVLFTEGALISAFAVHHRW